jgi:tetratricopeptide (TPR) repeat protein
VAAAVHEFRVASEERARQAELDRVRAEGERARAELRATEQRKRRKVQLALLGAVMLLVTGGGAVAWWQDKQATARKIEETRQASEKGGRETRNRDRFVIALEQCENALRAEDADMAALPLTEVENRVPEGGVEDFTPRVERCRKDLAMLEELDRIDNLRWTPTGRGFPTSPPIAEEWKQAFTRFGIVPGTTPVTEVVRLVNDSLIRDRLLTSLDLWLPSSPSRPDLAELLKALDPDDYRDAVRAAIRTTDADWRRYLFNHPKALEQPPRFAVVLGALYGPAERKRAILMRVMVGKPGNLAVLMALGATYRGDLREHAAERVRWYQAAVAARPRNVAAWVNLGSALVYMGEVDAAGDALKVAIQLDRKFATTARVNLGPLLENEGDVNGAVADYKKRLKDRPALIHHRVLVWSQGSDPTRSAKGDVNGDVNGHIVELKDLVELDPENWLLHQTLGSALMASGDVDGAIAAYEKLVELFPQHGYAHYQLGLAWEHKREYDRAIAAYQTLIASSAKAGVKSGESKAHARVGWLLFYEKKERAAGEAHLREATRLAPRVAQFHNDLGCVLRDSGRLGNAVACFQKAIELDPKYAHPVRNTGTVLEQRGDLDGAIQQYEKAIAIATTFAVARQDLDRVRKLKAERRPVPEAPLPREKKQP